MASDSDPRAISALTHNIHEAGLDESVRILQADVADAARDVPVGAAIVTNVPYGHGTEGGRELHDSYRRFGDVLRAREDLGPVVVLSGHRDFIADTGLKWQEVAGFRNRGLPVRLLRLVR